MAAGPLRAVAILLHELDGFETSQYMLRDIAGVWRARGVRVELVRGPGARVEPAEFDAAILHADVTTVPDSYVQLARRFPRALNAGTADISKRAISTNLVARADGYDGPVIVKTDRNCGGIREAEIARAGGLSRWVRAAHRRLHWTLRAELAGKDYRVYPSAREVPLVVWMNPWLVVEKFLPERHDGCYWLRSWIFLGEAEVLALRPATGPVIVADNILKRDFIPCDIPASLRARRRELGFDFGKFDFGIVGGEAVLYDANRTPTHRTLTEDERAWQAGVLADGL